MKVTRCAACLAIGSMAFAVTLLAATPNEAFDTASTLRIWFGDLNLKKKEGAAKLYERIRGAARVVCYPFESRELARQAQWKACYEHAVAEAVLKVHRPLLTAIYNSHQHPTTAKAASTGSEASGASRTPAPQAADNTAVTRQ
jgi:UrcA family protein